jgi:signal transduction histidine kinase
MAEADMRILLVEDDPDDVLLLREMLSEASSGGFQLQHVGSLGEAIALLPGGGFDVVLLDLSLPDSSGMATFIDLHASAPEVPVVVFTGLDDHTVAVRAVYEGAQDYLIKGQVDGPLLVRSMLYSIERQRTRHYRALLVERERFDTAVSQMSDGIVVTDEDWRIISANRAACLLLDLNQDCCGQTSLDEALEPFSLSMPLRELRACDECELTFDISRHHTVPPLYVDARLTRLYDSSGATATAVLVLRDVTDERRQHELQATFFSMVSHKLRTPLAILLGYMHLCRRLPPDRMTEELPGILDVCHAEVDRLTDVLQKLLDFKALSAGQLESVSRPTDIGPALADVSRTVRASHAAKGIEIITDMPADAIHAHCSAEHLSFVLEKLLDNAAKFGDKTPVRLHVEVKTDPESWLTVSVSDNGPGIPHEYYDRIFDGFVQVEDRPTGQVPGLGVGLHMARQVVEAYGGTISVSSRIGEGSTFSFTLPAAAPADVA